LALIERKLVVRVENGPRILLGVGDALGSYAVQMDGKRGFIV